MSRAQLNYSLRRNKTATRGSGATNQLRDAAAEKLNRKWICSDLGKFAIHTCRKRMISVQRELKKQEKKGIRMQIQLWKEEYYYHYIMA